MAQDEGTPQGEGGRLLTQKAYARRKGWSKQYVNQLVKKGRIPMKDGRIDPALADAALARERDPARDPAYRTQVPENGTGEAPSEPEATSQAPSGPFSKARTLRELYRARREKLEYEQLTGNLVSARGVKTAVYGATLELRTALQIAAKDLGKTLAGKYALDERELVAETSAAIDKALTQLSDRFRARCLAYKRQKPAEPVD